MSDTGTRRGRINRNWRVRRGNGKLTGAGSHRRAVILLPRLSSTQVASCRSIAEQWLVVMVPSKSGPVVMYPSRVPTLVYPIRR